MTGWGGGGWGNAKAQGCNEKEEGDSRLRGNDGTGGRDMTGWRDGNGERKGAGAQ